MNYSGTALYGDYDGEYDLCDCGSVILTPGKKICKSCINRERQSSLAEQHQRRKLANHRIYVFWHNLPQIDPVEAIGREIVREALADSYYLAAVSTSLGG